MRFLKNSLAALSLLLAAPLVHAELRLVPDEFSVSPVSVVRIQFWASNEGEEPLRVAFPDVVVGELHGGSDRSERVELTRVEGTDSASVRPGAFTRAFYEFRLPSGYLGPVVLDVSSFSRQPVMFSVQAERPAALASRRVAAKAGESGAAQATAADSTATRSDGERTAAMRRATRVLPGISAYDPVYFGLGYRGGLSAKFQLSLKYNPLDMMPVYMGFTQTSIWDLHGASKPFHDSAYRPSIFFLKEKLWSPGDHSVDFGLQAGFEHESNGRGGVDSRSINIGFARPRMLWRINDHVRLIVSPKVYGYIEKSENPDIPEYRGYVDLYTALLYGDFKLSTTLRKGTRANNGSVQVDAVIPLRITDRLFERVKVYGVNGYWFLQYFNGWGESIIDYRTKNPSQLRAGLMVVP